ncbi:ABC transporter substrate-binding protein [Fusibacter ferrireducens]|uniref:Substrate-binding domain-containing protein n=1 Tax=Fusibacter ferrireducens TaxID=2785058 RepID=A0ABR9ZR34_9FIRM|nr:substrate-binding domain-containing protein [Fusibacter ferrireducens]MBF4692909.1 substrate-binding domain-containing protein [Fusibacter ferrireducens]
MSKKTIILSVLVGCLIVALGIAIITLNAPKKSLILSTTTSTRDSGLLDEIIPDFEAKTGIEVKVVAVGTGKALQMGVDGEADVLLVHAKTSEEKFVSDGDGVERFDVMYNDFVLVGPKASGDQLNLSAMNTIEDVLKYVSENQLKFVSRGDDSGTNKKEISLWNTLELNPSGDWYILAGKGMGDVLMMASEMQAYTLTDRATFLAMQDKLDLEIVYQADEALLNYYGVIAVNPNKNDQINSKGAEQFIKWILSAETQKKIGEFGVEKYGQPLFFPNAK